MSLPSPKLNKVLFISRHSELFWTLRAEHRYSATLKQRLPLLHQLKLSSSPNCTAFREITEEGNINLLVRQSIKTLQIIVITDVTMWLPLISSTVFDKTLDFYMPICWNTGLQRIKTNFKKGGKTKKKWRNGASK